MNLDRFAALAEAYGGEISRWPEEERAAAETFAVKTPQALDILRAAAAVDAGLMACTLNAAAPAGLKERILSALPPQPRAAQGYTVLRRLSDWIGVRLTPVYVWGPGSGMVAAAVLGFWVGISGTLPTSIMNEQAMLLDPLFYETADTFETLLYSGEAL